MKRLMLVSLLTLFFASAVSAQRHDDKPHGMMKGTAATEQSRSGSTGGRHDEGPTSHGKKKPAKKTEQKPAADAVK